MGDLKIIGIDLAKNIFQIHGTDKNGKTLLQKRLKRSELISFMAQLPPCLVGIESCGGSHYWARKFSTLGHTTKLIAPQFVKPYVKSNKNDMNDAAAIAEAVSRPHMRFVPQKTVGQQDIQMMHRIREQLVKQRTALANQLRGLLAEYGVIIARGHKQIRTKLPEILEDAENELTPISRELLDDLTKHFHYIDEKISDYDMKISRTAKQNECCRRLMKIEGVGPLSATAMIAAVGNAAVFKNGREMSAYLGLVPKQRSSGGKTVLLGISKRGDRYLRTLLIHGGRAVVRTCGKKTDGRSLWVQAKKERSGENPTAVAVANKNVRIMWALLTRNEEYKHAV